MTVLLISVKDPSVLLSCLSQVTFLFVFIHSEYAALNFYFYSNYDLKL